MDKIFYPHGKNMGLRYVYGLNNSTSKTFLELIEEELCNNEDYPIIAITTDKVNLEHKLRKSEIVDKDLRMKIFTIEDVCNIVIKGSMLRKYTYLNDTSKTLILLKILSSDIELRIFDSLGYSIQLASLFSNTLKTLKVNRTTPELLQGIIDSLENSSTKDKLLDIYNVYKGYESYKGNNYIDKEDSLSITGNLLSKFALFKDSSVYIEGFNSFNKLEESIIEVILNQARRMTVSITTDSVNRSASISSAHFYKADTLTSYLNRLCTELSIEREEDVFIGYDLMQLDKNHLYKHLYKYPFSTFEDKTDFIYINEYTSMYTEVERVAYEICKLVSQGVDYENIAVVSFNFKEYEVILSNIFTQFEIPFNVTSSIPISSKPLIKYIYTIINLYTDGFSTKDIIAYLKCNRNLSKETSLSLISYLNYLCVDRLDINETLIERLERNAETEAIFQIYEELAPIKDMFLLLDEANSVTDKCTLFYHNLIKLYFGESVSYLTINEAINSSDIETWNKFSSIMSTLSRVFEDDSKSTSEFFYLLNYHLRQASILEDNKHADRVTILTQKDTIQNFDYIFLLNANDGVISFREGEDTLLNPIDKRTLSIKGIHIGASDEELRLREQYSTLKLLTLANKALYISIPLTDRTESTLKKAPIITRLRQLFPNCSKLQDDTSSVYSNKGSEYIDLSNSVHMQSLAKCLNTGLLEQELEELNSLIDTPEYKDKALLLSNALTFDNEATCSDKYTINELYFGDTFSVSKLERYNKCPFSYFVEYGLNIKEPEKKEPDFRHTGIFIHELIEKFITNLMISNKSWNEVDSEYIYTELTSIAENILKSKDKHPLLLNKRNEKHIYKLIDIAFNSLLAISNHVGKSFFNVLGNEISFGDKSTYPPITIRLDNGKRVKLRGQIDRVDSYEVNDIKYIRIVDYKTGDMKLSYSDIYNGLQLQLITYLDAIINASKDEGYVYKPAGVFYLKLDRPYVKLTQKDSLEKIKEAQLKELRMNGTFCNESNLPKLMDMNVYDGLTKTSLNINARFKTDGTLMKSTPGLTAGEFEDIIKYTKDIIKSTITTMLDGNISINPISKGNSKPCSYCNYKLVCMFDETLSGNSYKHIQQVKPTEALKNIREKVISFNE